MKEKRKWVGWATMLLAILLLLLPLNVGFILTRMCITHRHIPPVYTILDTIPSNVIALAAVLAVLGIVTLTCGIRSINKRKRTGIN